ncbi:hypothetical protein [Paracoccus benzoatiresistens]|uniref:DUF1611 domain-containing protein n=1 Tax=Paracoccus benzoatiresistens TaxID=2997341 RepID=A0ABT4J0N3_9RHOB|nr:hypothetical protein [Paracoccus sp. EF6]MCZ0960678.1 hypothetical protein [Paracoccus sp. EF6]
MRTLLTKAVQPRTGDLVLARVDEIWNHRKIELTDGRRALMFPGDEIIVCYGNRYAPDQFEAIVPPDLMPCDLVAAGGIAANELTRHQRMKPPTKITPLGLIGDAEGRRLNVLDFRIDAPDHRPELPAVLALGTSMNAGKTLTATSMVRGFKRAGMKVAALKITGTGAGGDMWIVRDAGADMSLDFTDAGYASTYLAPINDIVSLTYRLMNHCARNGAQVAVIEIADGLHQLETSQLIRRPEILEMAVGTVFASYDAMGAVQGVHELREAGHDVLGLSGQLGRAPLGVREAEAATGLSVFSPFDIQDGALIPVIRDRAAAKMRQNGGDNRYLRALAAAKIPVESIPDNLIAMPGFTRPADRFTSWTELEQDILSLAAHCVMQSDADQLCVTGKNGKRRDWRKGMQRLRWDTELGRIDLKVPRLKVAKYEPRFVASRKVPLTRIQSVIAADDESRKKKVESLLAALTRRRIGEARLASLLASIETRISEAAATTWLPASQAGEARTVNFWPVEPMTSDTELDELHHAELEISLLDRASA